MNKLHGLLIALMMEAASTYETSVNFYQTTRRNNPEDSHFHSRRLENLKSQSIFRFEILFFSVALQFLKNLGRLTYFPPFSSAHCFYPPFRPGRRLSTFS
jgi:hypothetical protein